MPHFDVHFAIGCVFASLGSALSWFTLDPMLFGISVLSVPFNLIIFCSIVLDFDYGLAIKWRVRNHRTLFTHSLWPPIILIIASVFLTYVPLLLGGMAMLVHVLLDAIDWGTNLLGDGIIRGPKVVMSFSSDAMLQEHLKTLTNPRCYFTVAWFEHRGMQILQIGSVAAFLATGIQSGLGFGYYLVYLPLYILFFAGHFREYLACKHHKDRA